MNIKFLLIGTSLSFLPTLSYAQCVATQDCATLGYTETSCNGGKGVKCPFGNKWACLPTETEICKKNGFTQSCIGAGQSGSGKSCGGLYTECSCASNYQYACTGTGYAGGAGAACGGKYTQCSCASGYEWKNGSCQPKMTDGAHGNLYYCNGKVAGVKTEDMNFYVAITNAHNSSVNWNEAQTFAHSAFCGKGLLPSIENLRIIYKNKSIINELAQTVFGQSICNDDNYWSSSYYNNFSNYHYIKYMSSGYEDYHENSSVLANVRAIIYS